MIVRLALPLPAIAFAAVALAISSPAAAKAKSVDDRLEAAGIKYEVDEDGDYKLGINWEKEARSQLVFVSGTTQEVNGLTIREVFAPAAIIDKSDITGKKALELLEASGQVKLGSWEIRGGAVYFVAKMLDSMSANELDAVINVVAETADNKEIELTDGKDDL